MADLRLNLADQAFINALGALVVPIMRGGEDVAEALVREALAAGVQSDHPWIAGLLSHWDAYAAAATPRTQDAARMAIREGLAEFFRWRAVQALARAEGAAA